MADAMRWLEELGLGQYAAAFAENDVDFDVLRELEDADLRELGVSLGHRKKLLRALRKMGGEPTVLETAPVPIVAPQHLSEQILNSRAALEGELKQVTVLFADIKGSTELIADMDAEAAASLLRRTVTEMMAAVHQYEGTVNKVLGDGIMAIFGAPIAHEDHAVRACYAALAMQARLARLVPQTRQEFGVELQVRQGINSGDVVVRAINNDLTMDYDAIGPTVHLAGRMEQIALPGTCRLTHSTYRLAEGYVEVNDLGAIPVRGIEEPVEVYELKGATDFRSRFLANQRGRLTRFVGRDGEIATLERVWKAAREGQGQSLSVVGEAGIGKSRLLYEFIHSPILRDVLILESGSVSHARAAAYKPLIDLLKAYFGIVSGDDERRVHEKVSGKLITLSESLLDIANPILALLGARPNDRSWSSMEPAKRRRATLDACRTLLLSEAQVQPLVVIFEDLHWIDEETQAFLNLLGDSVGRVPLLLLFNYRPEYHDPWIGKSYHMHIRIDPLPKASGEAMLADLLGESSDLDQLRSLLMDRTEGYPFYIEETVQGLVEEGVLAGEHGNYRLTVPVQQISVPPTIQSVIGARVDRLPPDSKHLLQVASVIGKDFELSLLRDVSGLDDADVQDQLAILQSGEFVYETRLFPDPEYTFKHALTHQVAYESLLRDRRREMHAQVMTAMAHIYKDQLEDRLERLVHHSLLGESWEGVHQYGMAAGRRALSMNANRSAMEAFDNAVLALERLPETPERLRDAVDCRFELRDGLFVLGETERAPALMEEARQLATKLEDQTRLVEIMLYQSGNDWAFGKNRSAITLARQARTLAEQAGDSELIGLANYRLASGLLASGDYAGAAEAGIAGAELLRPVARTLMRFGGLVQTFSGSFGAIALAELGRFDEAIALGRAAFETAVAQNHAYSISVGCLGIGHALALRGNIEAARGLLEEGLQQIEVHSVTATLPWVASRAANVFAKLGRLEDMESAIRLVDDYGTHHLTSSMMHPFAFLWVARAQIAAGRFTEANSFASRAVEQEGVDEIDESVQAWARWALIECGRLRGEKDAELLAKLDGVLVTAERKGMRPLRIHCLATYAGIAQDAGRAREARAEALELKMQDLADEIGAA